MTRARDRLDGAGNGRERLRRLVPTPVRRRYSLKIGVLVAAAMLVVATGGGVIFVQADAAVQESTEERLTGNAQMQAATVGEWNGRMKDQVSLLAASPKLEVAEGGFASLYLRSSHEQLPEYVAGLHLVDQESGEVLASSDPEAEGTDLAASGVPWAQGGVSAPSDEPKRTDPYRDPVFEAPAVAYLLQVDGASDHAVVLVVDMAARSEALTSAGNSSHTVVVDDDGRVVLSHRVDTIGTQNVQGEGVQSPAVEQGLTGSVGYTEMEMGGERVAMGFAPVTGADWVAMVHVPAAEAAATQDLILASVVGMLLVAFLALGLIAGVVGRGTASDIAELARTARRVEDGDLDATVASTREDELGDLYRSFDAMRESLQERIAEAEQARTTAEQAREESAALNRHLETKAEAYSTVMREVADGDLTGRLDPESDNEAMSDIATAFNDMMRGIETVVDDVARFADEVAASSEEVTASSEEIQSSSDQVAESVGEIADGADRQDETLQSVADEMNSLSTTIEEIASSADEVADVAERTAETGEGARETAEAAIDEMAAVEQEADATVAAMEDLQAQMEQIEEVTEFIQDVAEQTNILALNANIEAARAGEAGEGFAVVADEVKGLAEETREAAEEIDALVESVLAQTETTADEVRETSDEVGASVEAVERTVDALEEIAEYAAETNVGVQEISDATTEQAASTNEVVGMVDEAASIAEQTAAEASNAAGATQQQAAALSQMTDNASDLAAEADQLRETLGRFETGGTREGGPADGVEGTDGSRDADPDEWTPAVDDDTTADDDGTTVSGVGDAGAVGEGDATPEGVHDDPGEADDDADGAAVTDPDHTDDGALDEWRDATAAVDPPEDAGED